MLQVFLWGQYIRWAYDLYIHFISLHYIAVHSMSLHGAYVKIYVYVCTYNPIHLDMLFIVHNILEINLYMYVTT